MHGDELTITDINAHINRLARNTKFPMTAEAIFGSVGRLLCVEGMHAGAKGPAYALFRDLLPDALRMYRSRKEQRDASGQWVSWKPGNPYLRSECCWRGSCYYDINV